MSAPVRWEEPSKGYIPVEETVALVVDRKHPRHGELAQVLAHYHDDSQYHLGFADGFQETVRDDGQSPVKVYSRTANDPRLASAQSTADVRAAQKDYLTANVSRKTPVDFDKELQTLFLITHAR